MGGNVFVANFASNKSCMLLNARKADATRIFNTGCSVASMQSYNNFTFNMTLHQS